VETTNSDNRRRFTELAPEAARHQKVINRANFEFDSRRLHREMAYESAPFRNVRGHRGTRVDLVDLFW
jgi:hypothetical protein